MPAGGAETQITIINGHQYMRIPGTNTFQYLDPGRLHDEEDSGSVDRTEPPRSGRHQYVEEEDEEEEVVGEEEDTCSSSGDLLSESAIALSPQSNFTLEPDTDSKRDVDSLYQSLVSQPDGGMFDQQQYDDLMLIKSELQDEADLAEDASFLSWFEANQQLQLQQQLHSQPGLLD